MIYLLSFILFFISTGIASAHEAWILSPEQIIELSTAEPPEIFSGVTFITLLLIGFIVIAVSIAFKFETFFLGDLNQKIDKFLRPYILEFTPLIIRQFLGFMLLFASVGALPRFGMDALGHPTLFIPEFDLRLLGTVGTEWLFISNIQLVIAIMLIVGIYVRYAAVGVLLLTLLGFKFFGIRMLDYAPHFIAPSILLLYFGNGHYVTTNLPRYNPALEKQIRIAFSWKYVYQTILFLTGITFFYLGYSQKILNPNLIISILKASEFPSFGIPYDVLAMIMAVIEITGGILIAFGVLIRPLSLFLLSAIFTFTFVLNEPLLFHGNIIGLLCVTTLVGNSRLIQHQNPVRKHSVHSNKNYNKHSSYTPYGRSEATLASKLSSSPIVKGGSDLYYH